MNIRERNLQRSITSTTSTMAGVLSVASSIAGLLQVSAKVIGFLFTMGDAPSIARNALDQVNSLTAILHQLNDFIQEFETSGRENRKSMMYLRQIVTTLTGCVCAFSELEEVLEDMKRDQGPSMAMWDRAIWALREGDLRRILESLEQYKSSLTLFLTIFNWYVGDCWHFLSRGLR